MPLKSGTFFNEETPVLKLPIPQAPADDPKRMNVAESERAALSERDSLLVLDMLKNIPKPNHKLRSAIAALPEPSPKRE